MTNIDDLPAGSIIFSNADGKQILIIHADGRLERGDGFANYDDASVAFFDCLSSTLPSFLTNLRSRCEIADAYLERVRGERLH